MVGPAVRRLEPRIRTFEKPWLFGRFLLQEFSSSTYILHIDCDVWMVKPWLVPLVEDMEAESERDKVLWGGLDWGLIVEGHQREFELVKVENRSYINAGFFIFRNTAQVWRLMRESVERLVASPEIWFADQTILNIVFTRSVKGFLSKRFEKWGHGDCLPETINCHGFLDWISAMVKTNLNDAYLGQGGGADRFARLFKLAEPEPEPEPEDD
jgi:hypothetical protein